MKRRAEEGVRVHRPLSRANRNAFYCSDFNKVPQKKCASTHDIKREDLLPPKCGTYIWRLSMNRRGRKPRNAPERTRVPRRMVSPAVVVTTSRGHEDARSRGHKALLEGDDEEGPHREPERGYQDQGELQPQVGRRTRGKFAELKKLPTESELRSQ